jgi:DNA polymerase-4
LKNALYRGNLKRTNVLFVIAKGIAKVDRKILHIDQNCFFASVEMKNRPELRDVPMAVGGDQEQRHGIILAKNQRAGAFGIKTAETIWQARQKCPGLVVVPGHYDQYEYYSRKAFDMFCQYTDRVESFGLDECWLDVTDILGSASLPVLADEIRDRVRTELGLTCSVGGSFNKVFAKLGSDYKKPDATTLISRENFKDIVWPLPVEDLLYAGRATQQRLHRINIHTIGQLAAMSPEFIRSYLGKNGELLWIYANGLDASPVSLATDRRQVKSVGNSTTTAKDMTSEADIWKTIVALSDQVATRLRRYKLVGSTIQIHVRDTELTTYERQQHLLAPTDSADEISRVSMDLFRRSYDWKKPVRSLGVRAAQVSGTDQKRQISLFEKDYETDENKAVATVVDTLRMRFGKDIIRKGVQLAGGDELLPHGQIGWNAGGFAALHGTKDKE